MAAEEWFKLQEAGVSSDDVKTVNDACLAYIESLKLTNGVKSARDAELRLRRTVFNSSLGSKPLSAVRISHVKAWRDGLGLNPANSNRTLRSFKAALNMAVSNRQCVASLVKEWSEVQPLPDSGARRTLFLDLGQRRKLLAHCDEGSFRDLVEAAMLTGARGGELADAKRKQFDERTQSMTFIGKTRLKIEPRRVPISKAAVKLFCRLAEGKRADDLLFMRDEKMRWHSYDWGNMMRAAVTAAELPAATCSTPCVIPGSPQP